MANLKEKAKKKAKSTSRLASKAKARIPKTNMSAKSVDEIERDEKMASVPPLRNPANFNQAPPLPPSLIWVRKLATIPALRKQERGM